MAKALRKKGFPLFDDMAELMDGTHATGSGTFHAGQTPQSSQNTTASASTSYEPAIDPQLLNESIKEARISDAETDHEVPQVIRIHHSISNPLTTIQNMSTASIPRKSIFERERESLMSTVSISTALHT